MSVRISALLFSFLCAIAAQDSATSLARIAHVAFRVRDVNKSRDFYRARGSEEAFSFVDPGKPPVSYVKVNDDQFIELYGRADDSQPLGLMHVCHEASASRFGASTRNEESILRSRARREPAISSFFFAIRKIRSSNLRSIFRGHCTLRIVANT